MRLSSCFCIFFLSSLCGPLVFAGTEVITGRATRDGKWVYSEKHTVTYSGTQILSAHTDYLNPLGDIVAQIDSNFSKSLSAPEHTFKDLRFKTTYGIRYQDGQLVMFSQDQGEKEKVKTLSNKNSEALRVGCQGLAYYIPVHKQDLQKQVKAAIEFLIPGKLETYNFEMIYKGPDSAKNEVYEIHIKNWFLRVFAPKITVYFDSSKNRLIKYQGLSNLYDENKNMQNVTIDYSYGEGT